MIIFLQGCMGVGKTEYAKRYVQEHPDFKFLSWEDWCAKSYEEKRALFKENYIVDGWTEYGIFAPEIWMDATIWGVIAPVDIIQQRYNSRSYVPMPLTREAIELTQNGIIKHRSKIIFPEFTKEEIKFMFDKYPLPYQFMDIKGVNNHGSTACIDTWKRIGYIDYKDKRVLDLGCYAGYFCHRIKEAGASEVVGVDTPYITNIASDYAKLAGLDIKFRGQDLDEFITDESFDIILLLNTLHHLRSPFQALRKCFQFGKKVILEVEEPHSDVDFERSEEIQLAQKGKGCHYRLSEDLIDSIAKENGHKLMCNIASAREHRVILVYEHV